MLHAEYSAPSAQRQPLLHSMPEQPKQNKREGGVSHLNLMKDLGCTQLSNVLSTPNP